MFVFVTFVSGIFKKKQNARILYFFSIFTGEKPFKCTYCEYATAQNSTLKIHLKRHHAGTGDISINSDFWCNTCNENFADVDILEEHTKSHTSENCSENDSPLQIVTNEDSNGEGIQQDSCTGTMRESPVSENISSSTPLKPTLITSKHTQVPITPYVPVVQGKTIIADKQAQSQNKSNGTSEVIVEPLKQQLQSRASTTAQITHTRNIIHATKSPPQVFSKSN